MLVKAEAPLAELAFIVLEQCRKAEQNMTDTGAVLPQGWRLYPVYRLRR